MIPGTRFKLLPLLAVALAACQLGSSDTQAVPSVSQIGSDLKCSAGDHAYSDNQAGWGFCYPQTWKYNLRSQPTTSPPGLDLTFDITDVPCTIPSTGPGQPSAQPVCASGAGLFGFMIISTYERGGLPDLAAWVNANLKPAPTGATQISWGNATEAERFGDRRRIALTAHHVVILDLRPGTLDLEGQMSARLGSWKFFY